MAITKLKTLAACLLLCCLPIGSPAQTAADAPATEPAAGVNSTVDTLNSFVKLKEGLQQDIKALNRQIGAAQSEAEKNTLRPQLEKLEADLATVTRNFENVAAGVDITSLRAVQAEDFNFQRELFGLLKPAIDEMKEMTSRVRQKSDLKEKITYYQERLPVIKQALANVEQLVAQSKVFLFEALVFYNLLNGDPQFIIRKRLGEIVECPQFHGFYGVLDAGVTGHDNYIHTGFFFFNTPQYIHSVNIRKFHVQQGQFVFSPQKQFKPSGAAQTGVRHQPLV